MATKTKKQNGSHRVRFIHTDGQRRELSFRKGRGDLATKCQQVIEHLVAAKIGGTAIDHAALTWLGSIPDTLYEKLVRLDLVPARVTTRYAKATFCDFATHFVETNKDGMAKNTLRNHRQCLVRIREFFNSTHITNLTPNDAKQFNQWLLSSGLSPATVSREMRRAKQYMAAAIDAKIVSENVFNGSFKRQESNETRQYFITTDTIDQVMAACPDAEWRLIVALARYGGLRVPSELMGLRWSDVNWSEKRLSVDSPKNAKARGGPYRVVPLFAELLPYLEDAYHQAADGAEWVIAKHRGTNVNLRTQLMRILKRGGVPVWPKLFANLRSTRETELNDTFPMHVVCKWLENSPQVAVKHYLQTTDAHFAAAVGESAEKVAPFLPQQGVEMECKPMSDAQYCTGNSDIPVQYDTNRHPHGDGNNLGFAPDTERFVKVSPISAPPDYAATGLSVNWRDGVAAIQSPAEQLATALASLAAIDGISQRERNKIAREIARKILDGQ